MNLLFSLLLRSCRRVALRLWFRKWLIGLKGRVQWSHETKKRWQAEREEEKEREEIVRSFLPWANRLIPVVGRRKSFVVEPRLEPSLVLNASVCCDFRPPSINYLYSTLYVLAENIEAPQAPGLYRCMHRMIKGAGLISDCSNRGKCANTTPYVALNSIFLHRLALVRYADPTTVLRARRREQIRCPAYTVGRV